MEVVVGVVEVGDVIGLDNNDCWDKLLLFSLVDWIAWLKYDCSRFFCCFENRSSFEHVVVVVVESFWIVWDCWEFLLLIRKIKKFNQL